MPSLSRRDRGAIVQLHLQCSGGGRTGASLPPHCPTLVSSSLRETNGPLRYGDAASAGERKKAGVGERRGCPACLGTAGAFVEALRPSRGRPLRFPARVEQPTRERSRLASAALCPTAQPQRGSACTEADLWGFLLSRTADTRMILVDKCRRVSKANPQRSSIRKSPLRVRGLE